ncbi:Uncharacterised protein [Yersinia aleksiciae]|uniref:Uncharacterized protein n=1 Tax=Yersinia aleksiciae TaxID=263819 RepID=A0A0T9UY68_YERAE|nr:Uncharacterised protein [Yersinia aleksiciae]CNL82497.1 Uncharacterised protein [Yersinia aleksiciae]
MGTMRLDLFHQLELSCTSATRAVTVTDVFML